MNFYDNFVVDENCGVHANFRADDEIKERFYDLLSDGRYDSDRFSHSKYKADFNETIRNENGSTKSFQDYLKYQQIVGAKYCGVNFLKDNLLEVRTLNLSWDDVMYFYEIYEAAKVLVPGEVSSITG